MKLEEYFMLNLFVVTIMETIHPSYYAEFKTIEIVIQDCFGHLSISEKTNDTLTHIFEILNFTS